jgi:hypothetical protein
VAGQRLDNDGLNANLHVRSAYETELQKEFVGVVLSVTLRHHLALRRAHAAIRRIWRPYGLFLMKICPR